MGCHTLTAANGQTCFYCSTTMWAFGPVMDSPAHAEAFRFWLDQDPREVPRQSTLEIRWARFCQALSNGITEEDIREALSKERDIPAEPCRWTMVGREHFNEDFQFRRHANLTILYQNLDGERFLEALVYLVSGSWYPGEGEIPARFVYVDATLAIEDPRIGTLWDIAQQGLDAINRREAVPPIRPAQRTVRG